MKAYDEKTKQKVRALRSAGHTYAEIRSMVRLEIPKGSMNYLCRGIILNDTQKARIDQIMLAKLVLNRQKAIEANKQLFARKVEGYRQSNSHLTEFMQTRSAQLVALAMLYLGEGAKREGFRGLQLGSSSPEIITLYIGLLHTCYGVPVSKLRGRIQHRADQDPDSLLNFWANATGIPKAHFYPCYADKRTAGKTTKKTKYKGVCKISCAGANIQLELSLIAGIIFESIRGYSSAG